MTPSQDPNSTKYPDRTFYKGQWRTPEQIERYREYQREYQREHQRVGNITPERLEAKRARDRTRKKNPEQREVANATRRLRRALKRLERACAADPDQILISRKTHALVAKATDKREYSTTNHEKAMAIALLRREGLV